MALESRACDRSSLHSRFNNTHPRGLGVVPVYVVNPVGWIKVGEGAVVGGDVLHADRITVVVHVVVDSDLVQVGMAVELASDDVGEPANSNLSIDMCALRARPLKRIHTCTSSVVRRMWPSSCSEVAFVGSLSLGNPKMDSPFRFSIF